MMRHRKRNSELHPVEAKPAGDHPEEKGVLSHDDRKADPFALVIFGGAGDYSRRMLIPSMYHLFLDGALPDDFSVIGFGLPAMSNEEYRLVLRESLDRFFQFPVAEDDWASFARHLEYISSDFNSEAGFSSLSRMIGSTCAVNPRHKREVIFYFAVPPVAAPLLISQIESNNMCALQFEPKMVMEKPFGSDRTSAAALNSSLLKVFSEDQIFRVDHYLGKETVQNILFFRFANSIFEPLWDRRSIRGVEISMSEELGVEHRGAFYEENGVIRDVVQNHMMQLLALVAMEPPIAFGADSIRDEKVKLLRSIRPVTGEHAAQYMIFGQYGPGEVRGVPVPGYREEIGVDPKSRTPTFFAGLFHVDNWRWSGVPFLFKTGKRLETHITEILVHFDRPSFRLFRDACADAAPNSLRLVLQPDELISLGISVKYPGAGNTPYQASMTFSYPETFRVERHSAHERLILDCLRGDLILFARQDGIEAMWDVVDPVIKYQESHEERLSCYAAGSRGPEETRNVTERIGFSTGNRAAPGVER